MKKKDLIKLMPMTVTFKAKVDGKWVEYTFVSETEIKTYKNGKKLKLKVLK